MEPGLTLRTAWREIRRNPVRSVLSFSAITAGAASILYTLGQTHGMRLEIRRAIELAGPGRLEIESRRDEASTGRSPGLHLGDEEEIRRALPGLHMLYSAATRWDARFQDGATRLESVHVLALGEESARRDWVYRLRGRYLNARDVRDAERVCVVTTPGGWVKKPFWASQRREEPLEAYLKRADLLGRRILLDERPFTVVGVLQEPPWDKDPRWNRWDWRHTRILVPISAYHRYLRPPDEGHPTGVRKIVLDTGDEAAVPAARARVEAILRRRHRGEKDYEILDVRDQAREELEESRKDMLAATALGLVAFLAGGLGILNVTLATVFARTKEIGIRRALGASRSDILAQFLAEAALLGACGGLAGTLLGLAGIRYVGEEAERSLAGLAWHHLAGVVTLAAGVSAAFALYPAGQAARLDPVEALRNE